MKISKSIISLLLVLIVSGISMSQSFAQGYDAYVANQKSGFKWPEGKQMALSLTFDDSRLSQPDTGIPLLDKYGVKGTFYVSVRSMEKRLDAWKKAIKNGHDIGNHSLAHPCTGNYFDWRKNKALEDYTIEEMSAELDSANKVIEKRLGIKPVSFAYPCGNTYVGRGANTKSYVPVVASLFETGRGWLDEMGNEPLYCDMAQLTGMRMDNKSFDEIKQLIENAKSKGKWLILAGHEVSEEGSGNLTTSTSTLKAICEYALDPANGIWIDNVKNIADYVREKRGEESTAKMPDYKNPLLPVEQRVDDLISRMTLKEKLGQLHMPCGYLEDIGWGLNTEIPHMWQSGSKENRDKQLKGVKKWTKGTHNDILGPGGGFFTLADRVMYEGAKRQAEVMNELQKMAIEETRLGIPLFQIEEGTHGLMCAGGTIFPEGLAIGATWNKDLVRKIYSVAAKEGRSIGVHGLCTIVIEPNRDPRMGRNEEGYSEDPYMCSVIAEDIVKGLQGYDASAPDKLAAFLCHFPGQSEPASGLERGGLDVSEKEFRQVFLPPWVSGIKKNGALGVMATYPAINGVSVHTSEKILTDILRKELDFEGIVVSEGGGLFTPQREKHTDNIKDTDALAIKAGVDVNISILGNYMQGMIENIKEGKVPIELIDRSVKRVLRLKFNLGLFENPYVDVKHAVNTVHTEEHKALALETARQSIVLLKNENNLLPLKKNIKKIAVIGPNADAPIDQLGDYYPQHIPQEIVTVLKGIKNKVSSRTEVDYVKGCEVIGDSINEIEQAKIAAEKADVAILVVGEQGYQTNGEGRDVANLDLTGLQKDLIKAVHSTGTPTVVVLINGRALSIGWTSENIPAIVEGWMCGEQGGNAIADVLFGDYNPGGKLTVTFPRHVGQLPVYYNYSPAKIGRNYIDMPGTPLYEFGYGLSYTNFEYSNLQISKDAIQGADVHVIFDVKNTGKVKGDEVAQLYINDVLATTIQPVKRLRGYERVSLEPGETKTVKMKLTAEDLSLFNRDLHFVVEPGEFKVMVGSSSEDIRLEGSFNVD